nr:hypothetical protein [Tanacetum cinerariifolium]
ANSWQWDLLSSGSGNTLYWQWELILPVGTLSWQWECLVHFIPNTRRIVETIHVDFDELTAMASEQSSSGPALQEMIPGTTSSRFVQKSSSSTSYVPPSRNDWDLLFQSLFDEL